MEISGDTKMINPEYFIHCIRNEEYFITLFNGRKILKFFHSDIFYDVDNVIVNGRNMNDRNIQLSKILNLRYYDIKCNYRQGIDIEQQYFDYIKYEFREQLK